MKVCQTCGKTLNSNEVFSVNGFVQCEECAYSNEPATAEKDNGPNPQPIIQNIKLNNSWCSILKFIGKLYIIIGCVLSIVAGIIVYSMVDNSILISICVIVAGIVFSILSSSLLMAFAEMADNIAAIRYNSDKKQ